MTKPTVRGLVLAAGLGTRLRPLTDFLPKPLLPIASLPVAGHALRRLAAAGCSEAAINLCHLGEMIRVHFGSEYRGLPVRYSEEAEPLGTLGAVVPLLEFLCEADVVVVINGDSFCRWPIQKLIRHHLASQADVTLLFSRRAPVAEFGGGVLVEEGARVKSFDPPTEPDEIGMRRVFAGAHALSPKLLKRVTSGPADFISDLYRPMLGAGERIAACETSRQWFDLGTPSRYLTAVLAAGRGRTPILRKVGSRIASGARLARGAQVRRSVVEPRATVGMEASVRGSLLLAGAEVGAGAQVVDSIVGTDVKLPAGAKVAARLVTPERAGVPPGPGASIVGGLVYTPIVSKGDQ